MTRKWERKLGEEVVEYIRLDTPDVCGSSSARTSWMHSTI